MKTLIVYYSRTNNTKKVAEEIGENFDSQLVEIKSPEMKKGFWGYMKAGKQAFKKILPEIEKVDVNLEEFDLVVIGTPIWVGTIASPLRTFLTENKGKFSKVAFFCTCGDKQTKAFNDLKELTESDPIATLEINQKELKKGYQDKLQGFVNELKNN